MANHQTAPKKHISLENTLWVSGLSLASTANSEAFDIDALGYIVIFLKWTGTPTGTIAIECTTDGTNYGDIVVDPVITLSGAAGQHFVHIRWSPFKKVRLAYTRTSGTGSLDAYITGKSL